VESKEKRTKMNFEHGLISIEKGRNKRGRLGTDTSKSIKCSVVYVYECRREVKGAASPLVASRTTSKTTILNGLHRKVKLEIHENIGLIDGT